MHVHDEIAHLGIIHGHLRLLFPDRIGRSIIGIDTHDIDFIEIFELDALQSGHLSADDEVEQLFGRCFAHALSLWFWIVGIGLRAAINDAQGIAQGR